jgi:hypothetical protein
LRLVTVDNNVFKSQPLQIAKRCGQGVLGNRVSIKMTDTKDKKQETLDIVLMATYFFIPFYGLRIAAENYLFVDDLDVTYGMVIALVSSIPVTIYLTTLKSRTTKIKIIGLGILLLVVTIVNVVVY